MKITERQQRLIEFINSLDKSKIHVMRITCRGNEPWQIEEFNTITKLELKPMHNNSRNGV